MKYEVEYVNHPGYFFESQIAILTGLELKDILPITSKFKRWGGQSYVNTLMQLGYSCNPRFIKFDKETRYPCLIRTKKPREKQWWYGFVYYDGLVYVPGAGPVTWAEWNAMYPNFRITSMLQVWA